MKNKIFKRFVLFILGVVLCLFPFAIFQIYAHNQRHVYSKTYYAALVDKVNYLESVKNSKKILLIGGSNVAFGFNSDLIEKEFPEYKVVNFGLYAALGTKIMLDLSKDFIGEDDMIFIIPEINEQSMSLYYDPESTLKALEENNGLLRKLSYNDRLKTYGQYFSFVNERNKYTDVIDPGETVYRRENFNKYFDIDYQAKDSKGRNLRSCNRMKTHYDPSTIVSFSCYIDKNTNNMSSSYHEFIEYVNEYVDLVSKKGAHCYFSFCPVNKMSLKDSDDLLNESLDNFYWSIRKYCKVETIGNPYDYIIDDHYFYDSNFHLNDAGSIYRTDIFLKDVYRDIFKTNKMPSIIVPAMPEYPEMDPATEDDSDTCKYFDFVEIGDYYAVSKIKNDVDIHKIVMPQVLNHRYIIGISSYCFQNNSTVSDVVIPDTYSYLEDHCFDNSYIKNVFLDTINPDLLTVNYDGSLIGNVHNDFSFYVYGSAYEKFVTNYYWGNYVKYLKIRS